MDSKHAFEWLDGNHADRQAAFALILTGSAHLNPSSRQQLETFCESIQQQKLDDESLGVVRIDRQIAAAGVNVLVPGRSAMLFLGHDERRSGDSRIQVALVKMLVDRAWTRGVVLLQTLLEPNTTDQAVVLERAGFSFLAALAYLNLNFDANFSKTSPCTDLSYVVYSHHTHADFLSVISQTYEHSLDCPQICGIRRIEDVLLGHRHTGLHDDSLWLLACRDHRPVGVLLLSGLVGQAQLEVVYMGVVREMRGQRVGDALIAKAIDLGRQRVRQGLTLAVDCDNTPARQLYARWGFREMARRHVWIRVRREGLDADHLSTTSSHVEFTL